MTVAFKRPARPVDRVFIHCSASDAEDLAGPVLVAEIGRWHLKRGFREIGYHLLIDRDGALLEGRSLERTPAAQAGHNARTIAICVHGLERFTEISLATLVELARAIDAAYGGAVTFHGHREVNRHKTCPVFDYRSLLGLDDQGRMNQGKG